MATLYITELASLAQNASAGTAQVGRYPQLGTQTVSIGVSSAASAAFSGATQLIRVHTDSICSIEIGPLNAAGNPPTASNKSMRLAANSTEYLGVAPGHYLSVIQNT
jgi:hypothetical protein